MELFLQVNGFLVKISESPMKLARNSSILILSHFNERSDNAEFPPQIIRDYLKERVKKIIYIEHAFPHASDKRSSMATYENGCFKKRVFTPCLRGPQILFYVFDIFITFYFILLTKSKFDLCIALDNLNTVSVFPFRKIGLIKKLVFYTIDYSPKRFENKQLNHIYHFFDKIACYNSDSIWILSNFMEKGRIKNGIDPKKTARSILLPMGASLSRIKILPFEKINRHDIVFVGHLLEKQGIQLILETLPLIISKISNLKFIVIGQGEFGEKLKDLAKKLKIIGNVVFKGFIEDKKEVERILCESAIGIATYVPTHDNYTLYTDPGKPKLYLGCGLPVIITKVPAIAKTIASNKAGILVDYKKRSIYDALFKLLTNDIIYKAYRKNAIYLSKDYDTDTLISNAISKI